MKLRNVRKQVVFFILCITVLLMTVGLTAASQAVGTNESVAFTAGTTLYTQFSLYYEKNCHITTNYRRGILVPVNTQVKLVKSTKKIIMVTLPDGQKLKIKNIPGFSGETIDGIFKRTFAVAPVNLSQFTETEKKAIMAGEVTNGMRKSAVIVAIGYPPKHKTPNLRANAWQYWQSRFDTFIVHFTNDKVTQIQD
jgi:hypothetical protein